MSVLVSVGTTSFEDLIRVVDSPDVKLALNSLGFTEIICQIGQGEYVPALPNFRSVPNLTEFLKTSDLVISHAGAGTIIDALRLGKKLIVVVNPTLMNNHQEEIAEMLGGRGHLIKCSGPNELLRALEIVKEFQPVPLPKSNVQGFFNNMNLLINN